MIDDDYVYADEDDDFLIPSERDMQEMAESQGQIPAAAPRERVWDKPGPANDKTITCKFCGLAGFRWKELPTGWRLVDSREQVHVCKNKGPAPSPLPAAKVSNETKIYILEREVEGLVRTLNRVRERVKVLEQQYESAQQRGQA
jgi:hypothetical protein